MAKNQPLTSEEASRLFSEIDESGVVDPDRAREISSGKRPSPRPSRRLKVDPLSEDDPSGSKVGQTISRTAILVITLVLLGILGMQIWYGVSRRLNTANLSENVDRDTVEHAMESGVEWGNGFTQFPATFTVDEADQRTGVVEVTVVDTDSRNELEMLSNSQIQAAALATNALLNDKIDRVVYNVCALVNRAGDFQHDSFFGFLPAKGTRRAVLTFIWIKSVSSYSNYIDWELKIVGMDDQTAQKIQEQVNSVSALIESSEIAQNKVEEEREEMQREKMLHGSEIFTGGKREKSIESVLPPEK